MSTTIVLSPVNRVEGDLRIKVDIQDNRITDARAAGIMFRGFEKILKGRFSEEALVVTPRICGLCSIAHSVACSNALAAISEPFTPSGNGQLARNICHATENAMSHLSHFYLYFAPDLANGKYKCCKHYGSLAQRMSHLKGDSTKTVIQERKRFLEILGIIVGKWPHTLAIHAGGVTKSLDSSDVIRIRGILAQFTAVVESAVIGMPVADYLRIKSVADFQAAFPENRASQSDLGTFYHLAVEAGLLDMGQGPGKFITPGSYPQPDGSACLPAGCWNGSAAGFDPSKITEAIQHSFFSANQPVMCPSSDTAEPKSDKPGAYSWAKAPRYGGEVVEVGPLARQIVSRDPLIMELFGQYGSTVFTRVVARLHEAVKLLRAMRDWMERLNTEEPYYARNTLKDRASGIGLTEAARGILGHWISVEKGRITNYQVITPTAWNASPRDEKENPGALERALIGTRIADETNPVEIQHVIRSYDPCLVCTVH